MFIKISLYLFIITMCIFLITVLTLSPEGFFKLSWIDRVYEK